MNAPRVLNKYHWPAPVGSVYIGRPSPWGNPFEIGRDGDRDEVVAKYREWLALDAQAPLREAARRELRGRSLVCFCKPKACHGDVLLEIANS